MRIPGWVWLFVVFFAAIAALGLIYHVVGDVTRLVGRLP